jgi:Zn finger protein HypA/HybF involved in hydrogenase expression
MSNYEWSNKEVLIKDLQLSESTSDFLNSQGLVATSGNYDTFKKWMKFHGIDKEQYFKPKNKPVKQKLLKSAKVLNKQEVLCFNSSYSRRDADKLIRKENLIKYKCRGCNNEGQWYGKSITLQLEHKNGDSTDHRLENLEYLCPNCHSQTLTYGSKNTHNRVFEIRIKDLIKIKDIKYIHLNQLSKSWKIDTVTIKNWIKLHAEKICSYGITIQNPFKEEYAVSEENVLFINKRLDELKLINTKNKPIEEQLSKNWSISKNAVKKWLKKHNEEFYLKHCIKVTPTFKAKQHQKELYNQVSNIINNSKEKGEYNLTDLMLLFKNKNATLGYLRLKFPEYYKLFYKTPPCISCSSLRTSGSGQVIAQGIKKNRYKCLDCNKQFYENIIKTLDMIE